MESRLPARLALDEDAVAAFCRRWKITELALFGSVLREDFDAQSDVDVLVSFATGAGWTLFDLAEMQDELSRLMGRDVDLVSRSAVEASRNWVRRRAILESARLVYAA